MSATDTPKSPRIPHTSSGSARILQFPSDRISTGVNSSGDTSADKEDASSVMKTPGKLVYSPSLVPEALDFYRAEGCPELESYVKTLCDEYYRVEKETANEDFYRFVRRILIEMNTAKYTLTRGRGIVRFRPAGENTFEWNWESNDGTLIHQGEISLEKQGDQGFMPPVLLAADEILTKYSLKDRRNVLTSIL